MERNKPSWSAGDTCVLIVSIPKRYTQEFEVQGFDGKYYTVKRGNPPIMCHRAGCLRQRRMRLLFWIQGILQQTMNTAGKKILKRRQII